METHALPHFVESNILNSDDKKKNSISEPVHPPKNKNPLIGFFFSLKKLYKQYKNPVIGLIMTLANFLTLLKHGRGQKCEHYYNLVGIPLSFLWNVGVAFGHDP